VDTTSFPNSTTNLPNSTMSHAMNPTMNHAMSTPMSTPKVCYPPHDRLRSPIDSSDVVPARSAEPLDSLENTPTSRFSSSDSRDRWLRDARQQTDEYFQDGPRAPTTWVLTNGHNLPDYAIEAGEEGGNTLYVARAYVEVKPSFAISSITKRNLTRTRFNSGWTVYDLPRYPANTELLHLILPHL